MKTLLRVLFLAAGLAVFGWFIHRAGPGEIVATLGRLGWRAPLILITLAGVYALETLGWRMAFGSRQRLAVGFPALYRVRLSGEAVNNVVPSGTVGGEAVKVYLLHRRGVPAGDAAAATIIGRTVQTLMQVTFIALGSAAFLHLAGDRPGVRSGMAIALALCVGLIVTLFYLQSHGMFTLILRATDRLGLHPRALVGRAERLRAIDRQVIHFYTNDRRSFVLSAACYLAAWLLDTFDLFVAAWLLGMPVGWLYALGIEAFIGVAKLLGFLVPGGLGIQETGIALVCHLAGLPPGFGPAYAIIRRGRDLFYAGLGWLLLYAGQGDRQALRGRVARQVETQF